MKINERLKFVRKTEGYTQKEFCKLLDITEQGYQKLEYGTHTPGGDILQKLCNTFPEYTLWLMTGKTSDNQIDPYIKQSQSNKTG